MVVRSPVRGPASRRLRREFPLRRRLLKARHWARQAGRMALDRFRDVDVEWKQDRSLVTEADREIERMIRDQIGKHYPGDAVVGEEYDPGGGQGEWTWFIDPIDGTAAYASRLHVWCTSIGLFRQGQPVAGVLWVPYTGEEYLGGSEREPTRNQKPIDPEARLDWTRETLLLVPSRTHALFRVDFPGKCRSLGSTAYHMAMVMDGRGVAACIGQPRLWDIAAVWAMGRPGNCELRDLRGEPPSMARLLDGKRPRRPLLFGPSSVLEKLRGRIREQTRD